MRSITPHNLGMSIPATWSTIPDVIRRPRLVIALALIAAGLPLGLLIASVVIGQPLLFNDFHSYWLAGRLLQGGSSPYDLAAMRTMALAQGLHFELGTGYSYPLPFAFLMIPFALLPFTTAVLLFTAISLVAFGWLVAWWLTRHHPGASDRRLLFAAALAGLFPPVFGTIAQGQANLVLLLPLGLGLGLLGRDGWAGRIAGGLLGLATIVKLVPAALLVVLLGGRRWVSSLLFLIVGGGALLAADWLAPPTALTGTWLARLLEPDPYFSNQSLNGFVSRLVRESERSLPLIPNAFDPTVVTAIATVALGLATLLVLARSARTLRTYSVFALGLALALVAATIGAPKNSFWNQALALPAFGLLLAVEAPDLHLRGFGRADRALLFGSWLGSIIQLVLWILPPPRSGSIAAVTTLVDSAALYGMVAFWVLLIRRLGTRTRWAIEARTSVQ